MPPAHRRAPVMLGELRLSGLGVIEDAVIAPAASFTVVSGETGAGKTMIVTALGLVGGGRASADRVRSGAAKAVVEARFTPLPGTGSASALAAAADGVGGDVDDDGSLVAVRTVSADGRSRAHIGGRAAPVAALGEVTAPLVTVHGQAEAFSLLKPSAQRQVLDTFADLSGLLDDYRDVREAWLAVRAELADRTSRARERAQREQLLRMGIAEIEAAAPQPGEDVELATAIRRLSEADTLRTAAQTALAALAGTDDAAADQPGAAARVQTALRALEASADPALTDRVADLRSIGAVIDDVAADLAGYLDDLDVDPARLEHLLQRQGDLRGLVRRYGEDVDAVLEWAADARVELAGLDSSEEALASLWRQAEELTGQVAAAARKLTDARTAAAADLGRAATAELDHLAMGRAMLRVAVTPRTAPAGASDVIEIDGTRLAAGPDGADTVEILLTAHPGAPELPVAKGASGGELSRVMLALEVVLAGADPVATIVFDEVDTGVGGRAATEIGRRLALLANHHQVIVVTHLAQVAAFADKHIVVTADADGSVGASAVRTVTGEDRLAELARMLGGTDGDTARAHAAELLAGARAPDHGATS